MWLNRVLEAEVWGTLAGGGHGSDLLETMSSERRSRPGCRRLAEEEIKKEADQDRAGKKTRARKVSKFLRKK